MWSNFPLEIVRLPEHEEPREPMHLELTPLAISRIPWDEPSVRFKPMASFPDVDGKYLVVRGRKEIVMALYDGNSFYDIIACEPLDRGCLRAWAQATIQ